MGKSKVDRCVMGDRNRPAYEIILRTLNPSMAAPPVLQRWKLCAQDRDRVQGLINDAVEEVKHES